MGAPPRKKPKKRTVVWPPPPVKDIPKEKEIPGRSSITFSKWLVESRAAEREDALAQKDLARKVEKEKLEAAEGEEGFEERPKDDAELQEEFQKSLSKWFRSIVGHRGRAAAQKRAAALAGEGGR